MQSDGKGFYGDVVSDRFNKMYQDEENILTKYTKANMFV